MTRDRESRGGQRRTTISGAKEMRRRESNRSGRRVSENKRRSYQARKEI